MNLTMRHANHSIFLTAFLIPFFLTGYAQELKFGARAALGTGAINSKVLENYFMAENNRDADIKKYDLNAKLGTVFSIGGFVEYPLNNNLSLIGEIGFLQQSSNLQIDLMEDDAQDGLTFRDEVESNNRIKMSALSAPLLARYYLSMATDGDGDGVIEINPGSLDNDGNKDLAHALKSLLEDAADLIDDNG